MWSNLRSKLLARLPNVNANGSLNGVHPAAAKTGGSSWEKCFGDLARYRTYSDDWDGQGAVGIPSDLVDSAVALVDALRSSGVIAPSCALPGFDGTVSFEWDLNGGCSLEVEVLEPGKVEVSYYTPGGSLELETLTESMPV